MCVRERVYTQICVLKWQFGGQTEVKWINEEHLHLNSTFHLLRAPKRFTNPAEQNDLRKHTKKSASLPQRWTSTLNLNATLFSHQSHSSRAGATHPTTTQQTFSIHGHSLNEPHNYYRFHSILVPNHLSGSVLKKAQFSSYPNYITFLSQDMFRVYSLPYCLHYN